MTSPPPTRSEHPLPPTELPAAISAQIDEARLRLRAAGAGAGVAAADVDAAVDRAVERYRGARVHAFLGVLVERAVCESLGLRGSMPIPQRQSD